LNLLKFFKIIFEGYKKGKRIKNVYISEKDMKLLRLKIEKFDVYDRKFLLLLSLFVIYKYHPQSFYTFIEKLEENLENRNEYFKFKKLLKHPYEFIKQDIEYLVTNHFELDEETLLELFNTKKISFYTFYMLLKDKETSIISKEILKTISYILQFLKIKIDNNWFSAIKLKDNSLF
jgi:hypothetical protein